MRFIRYTLLITIIIALTGVKASAKTAITPKGYMFGFVANFSDSVVYITDIQTVDSVWYDTKSKFLLGRSTYANQLRDYFSEKLDMPHRTCIVVFALTRKEIEKKYLKMKKLYTVKYKGRYDVKNVNENDFHFTSVNLTPEDDL